MRIATTMASVIEMNPAERLLVSVEFGRNSRTSHQLREICAAASGSAMQTRKMPT
jgi:hypothetical protein